MKRVLMFIIVVMASVSAFALTAGDIAIIGVNTDATKSVAFVALTSIPANTTISFTDNAWNASTAAWRTGEGTIVWSHTSAISAGTVIALTVNANPYLASTGSITYNSNFNLSASGDQILAYEGTTAPTTNSSSLWLYGFSTESFTWGNNTTSSDIPTALSGASVAMTTSTTETDNAYFANGTSSQTSVTVSGTKTALLALFNDRAKYYQNDAGSLTFPTYSITVSSGSTPSITVTPATLSDFTYEFGKGPSEEKSFALTGSNLTAAISVSVTSNYAISSTSGGTFGSSLSFTPSSGSVSATVYVRQVKDLAIGSSYTGTVTCSSTSATDKTVSLSGAVTSPPAPDQTTATAATSVATDGFTANWDAVSGATGYRLDVYTKTTGANATGLFISEYIEGSSNNKYIEIYNGTGASVSLTGYSLKQYNGTNTTPTYTLDLSTGSPSIASGSVYVIANSSATIYGGTPDLITTSQVMTFNGNDAVALFNDTTLIDVIGTIGDGTDFGKDATLVRKAAVTVPSATYSASDWDSYTTDTVTYLGSHTMAGGSTKTFVPGFEDKDVSNVTTYDITGLDPSTTYYYVVRAYNAYGTSPSSGEISAETGDAPLPVELSSFTAVLNAQNYVNIMWVTQTETSLTGFYVYRSDNNDVANAAQISALINPTNTSQQQVYLFTDDTLTEAGTYYYWLQIAEMDGTSAFSHPTAIYFDNTNQPGTPNIPLITELNNVYPNPFNPTATISYGLAKAADVNINIYNARGQIVRSFNEGTKAANSYKLVWNGKDNNGSDCSTGIYYINMQAGKDSFTRKAVLMK
ncbi:MAG: lamin tail domain-containing protein [Candidatus Cloacimonetes bacterium]|nr:lamin tail domain-containing protein [Candidatus Cloacimonadota bacterium]